jgi:hypothetical protein
MPIHHNKSPVERAAELERDERETRRDVRRAFVAAAGGCVVSAILGLLPMAWALHTSDPALGEIGFLAGPIIGYTGITIALARYYLKGERNGWW